MYALDCIKNLLGLFLVLSTLVEVIVVKILLFSNNLLSEMRSNCGVWVAFNVHVASGVSIMQVDCTKQAGQDEGDRQVDECDPKETEVVECLWAVNEGRLFGDLCVWVVYPEHQVVAQAEPHQLQSRQRPHKVLQTQNITALIECRAMWD